MQAGAPFGKEEPTKTLSSTTSYKDKRYQKSSSNHDQAAAEKEEEEEESIRSFARETHAFTGGKTESIWCSVDRKRSRHVDGNADDANLQRRRVRDSKFSRHDDFVN